MPRKTLAASMVATLILTIITGVLLTPLLGAEGDLVTLIVDFAYPLFDLTLFSVAYLGLIIFWKGKLGKTWLFINAAIAMYVCADILFSYTTAKGTYYCGHMLELLYHFGYALRFGVLSPHKRALSLTIMYREKVAFDKAFADAVDECLLMLGESGKEVVYFRLRHFYALNKEDVLFHPEIFDECLRKILAKERKPLKKG